LKKLGKMSRAGEHKRAGEARSQKTPHDRIIQPPFFPDFLPEQLEKTPSIRHGMSEAEEREERMEGIKFLMACAHQLRLPYNATCTACVYFHKFYMRRSFKVHTIYDMAAACLYLAAKSEEQRKRTKEIAETCYFLQHKQKVPDPRTSEKLEELNQRILDKELLLLQTLEFNFQVQLPHTHLPAVVEWLGKQYAGTGVKDSRIKKYGQVAWFFLQDSFKSPMCLFIPPLWMVLICVELALRYEANCSNPELEKQMQTDEEHPTSPPMSPQAHVVAEGPMLKPPADWYFHFVKEGREELSVEAFSKHCAHISSLCDFEAHVNTEPLRERKF